MRSYQVVEFGHTLRDTDMLDPRPIGDEVVIAVKAAGVCHSDLHLWEGGFDLGGGRRLTLKDRGIQLPLTLGHETAGEIVSLGPNVTDRKVGELCWSIPGSAAALVERPRRDDRAMRAALAMKKSGRPSRSGLSSSMSQAFSSASNILAELCGESVASRSAIAASRALASGEAPAPARVAQARALVPSKGRACPGRP